MREKLLQRVESIPPLPESVQEVERLYRNIDSTLDEMQVAIEKDPLLAANILRLVNSPLYELETKVTSLKRAILLLGKAAIRTFALSSSIDANFEIDLSPYNLTPQQFQRRCEFQMALAIGWLQENSTKSASLLITAAFMADVGRLVLAQVALEDNQEEALRKALENTKEVSKAEKDVCGASAHEITAALFRSWELDEALIRILESSEEPQNAPQQLAELTAQLKAIRQTMELDGSISEASLAGAKATIEEFGLNLEAYESALDKLS